ncbi:collagen alpha-1(III) chain-like [Physeter macrocephalus]|uniref:Collagen alpha-1(III) chain-like n=1 Tax=Physeter macrocephalus TaxID=9755 RepID=A0A2Y9SKM0_PHYMC|nr:collagen alpha-1(III) chain-like [Physeter catodon]|eukprot:XP_023978948.1 collagen alpha-1(III) chain-like [Physeter catodon]
MLPFPTPLPRSDLSPFPGRGAGLRYLGSSRTPASVEPRLPGRRAEGPPPFSAKLAAPGGPQDGGNNRAGPSPPRGAAVCGGGAGGEEGARLRPLPAPLGGPGAFEGRASLGPRSEASGPLLQPSARRKAGVLGDGERAEAAGVSASCPPEGPGTLACSARLGGNGTRADHCSQEKREPPIRAFECTKFGGAAEKVERRGEGKEEAPGTISELTVTPPATALAPGGRAGARGRPPRVPVPGPAERGVETAAGREPPVSPRPLQIGLCSREDSSFLSRTLPSTLRPSSSPHFFPGGRVPTHWRPLGWTPGTGEARAPRRAGCVGEAESRWAAAGLARGAPVPGGGHSAKSPAATPGPAHSPMYLWPVRWGRVAAAAAEPGTGPGSQLPALGPRRASGYPGAGVSRPIGARGDSALTAVPGDRSSDIIDNTFLSSCFIPALCTCGGQE